MEQTEAEAEARVVMSWKKDKKYFFCLVAGIMHVKTHGFILDGCSEHVAHIWSKIGLYRFFFFFRFDDSCVCKQMPSTNRNTCPYVRTMFWASIWYYYHD